MPHPSAPIRASQISLSNRPKILIEKVKISLALVFFCRHWFPANERDDLPETTRDRRIRARRWVHTKADEATGGDDSHRTQLSLGRRLQDHQGRVRDSRRNGERAGDLPAFSHYTGPMRRGPGIGQTDYCRRCAQRSALSAYISYYAFGNRCPHEERTPSHSRHPGCGE